MAYQLAKLSNRILVIIATSETILLGSKQKNALALVVVGCVYPLLSTTAAACCIPCAHMVIGLIIVTLGHTGQQAAPLG